jgi:integrase/recombinase XerD
VYRHVDEYLNFLAVEKGASLNTLEAYSRDLNRFIDFVERRGIQKIGKITSDDIVALLGYLKSEGLVSNSVNRTLAALRGFYKHLLSEKVIDENPVSNIDLAKVWMRLPDTLSREEVNILLEKPDLKTLLGVRDAAMLELMYATGIRVSELV